jgi:hypothetical protein
MAAHGQTASAAELARWVAQDPQLRQELADDPSALLGLAKPTGGNKWIYRFVVLALGLTALFVVIGVFTLKALDNTVTIPDALVAIGSAAIAALAGLLAPSPAQT